MNRKRLGRCLQKNRTKINIVQYAILSLVLVDVLQDLIFLFFRYESVNKRCKIKWEHLNILSITYNNVLLGSTLQLKIKLSVFMCSYVFLKNLHLSLCTYQLKTLIDLSKSTNSLSVMSSCCNCSLNQENLTKDILPSRDAALSLFAVKWWASSVSLMVGFCSVSVSSELSLESSL